MIKHLWRSLAILLLTSAVATPSETARRAILGRMFTQGDYFGFPGEPSNPFPCTSSVERSTYWDTVSHVAKVCDGTNWVSIGTPTQLTGLLCINCELSTTLTTSGTWTGNIVWNARVTIGTDSGAAGSIVITQTQGIQFEGATADAFETTLDVTDPTGGDQTYRVPNAGAALSDTLVALTTTQTLTNKTLSGNLITAGATPAVSNTGANSCGTTTATIAGSNASGIITVGATAGTSCTVTFTIAATTRRQCWCSNETTLANVCNTHYTDTTHTNVVGTFVAGDVVNYGCLTY